MSISYRPEIDGLRAVAVMPVVLYHAGYGLFGGGFAGVDVFFVISGYLITSIILSDLKEGRFSLLRFYERRARRILPALFLVMACTIPFAWMWMWPDRAQLFAQSLIAVSLFVSNFYFFANSDYFDVSTEEMPLIHTWSLAVEEQFYLLFPLFLMIAWRFGRRPVVVLISAIALASLALAQFGGNLRFAPPYLEENLAFTAVPTWGFYLPPTRAWELMAGCLAAFALENRAIGDTGGPALRQGLSLMGLALIAVAVFGFTSTTPFPSLYTLAPVVGALLIILFAMPGTVTHRLLSMRAMVGIGLISYSIYLWHVPVFTMARIAALKNPEPETYAALILLTLGLAYLSWRIVERPFRDRGVISRRTVAAAAVACVVAFCTAGHAGNATGGFAERFGPEFAAASTQMSEAKAAIRRIHDANMCYYYSGKPGLESLGGFLRDWPCGQHSAAGAHPTPLIFVGDSHAADKAAAARLAGLGVGEMTGGGCSLDPDLMGDICERQFGRLREWLEAQPARHALILNNRFLKNEVTDAAIARTIAYWRSFPADLVLMTSMPEFRGLPLQIRDRAYVVDTSFALGSESPRIFAAMRTAGIPVINTRALFCDIAPACAPVLPDGRLLLIDYAHMSIPGAEQFGRRLVKALTEIDPRYTGRAAGE